VGGNLSRLLPLIAVLGIAGILAPSPGRAAELPCSERVLTDWADNGRIDRPYELQCYEEAIDALPMDIRDYTSAEDVIARAQQSAARGEPAPVRQAAVSPAASSSPTLLLVLAGVSVAVLAAGVLGFVVRRDRRAS
jgi:hypothetical protein